MNIRNHKLLEKSLSLILFFVCIALDAQTNSLKKDNFNTEEELPAFKAKEVKIYENIEYYSVSAKSKSGLVEALIKSSPILSNGDGYLGQTETHFKWAIDWLTDNSSCWVKNAYVDLYVTFRLPKLETTSKEVIDIWNEWYPKLLKHEQHHRDIDLNIATQILKSLNNLSPATSCDGLLKKAENLVKEYDKESTSQQEKYDLDTNHGETEGLIIRLQ